MIALPLETALTACRVLDGTIPTKPGPRRLVTPSIVISSSPSTICHASSSGWEMLMNRRAGAEFVVRESHAGRIKITASPSGLAFDHRQLVGIDECHLGNL